VLLSVVVGFAAVWGGARLARVVEATAPPASGHAKQELFERQADPLDPAQGAGAQRDIRDATVEPPGDV